MTAEASQAGPSAGPASDGSRPLRIALLTYKGNPFCGGQGVYVRHLSRELARLGHRVEVIGAQPYPVLDEGYDGLSLTELPSLDLYRQPDPFRTPKRDEYRDWIDALEVSTMWTGGFPEPLTFSLRARRHLRARRGDFDVVHDNQTLGYGLLGGLGAPLVTTIHHPITVDRRLELDAAADWKRRLSVRRWYAFTRMQKRVARRLPSVLTVSGSSRAEIVEDLGVRPDRVHVVHIGADTDLFSPDPSVAVVPGRIVTTSSADVPLKGLVFLVEALAKVRAEQPGAHLVVVGKRPAEGPVAQAIERYGLEGAVDFVKGISDAELVDLVRSRAGRLRAVALRGLLPPGRRGHGHRHPARRHHRRRHPRGRGTRRGDLPGRPARRRGRPGRRPHPAARRRRPARPPRRRRTRPGAGQLHLGARRRGHRRPLPRGHRDRPRRPGHGPARDDPGPAGPGARGPRSRPRRSRGHGRRTRDRGRHLRP
ncbi:glycosyltransferase involved in cell wall biosynthesis [Streptomyces albogriseolus]